MVPCPICNRPASPRAQNASAPFCTPRCKQIDLGNWFSEKYAVPVPEGEEAEEGLPGESA
jgi:endogenous inhibitor of DNA gyrase (YacG/DUF329 family)